MSLKIFLILAVLLASRASLAQEAAKGPEAGIQAVQPAIHVSCERQYSRIDYKQNFLLVNKLFPTAMAKAKARVVELERIKVKDIFPDIVDAPDGFSGTIKAPNTNKVRRAKYQKTFDELMEERVKAGLFPRQELTAWRTWMKETQQKNRYPSLMDKDILEFIEGNGTLAEFIDLQFLRYIRASKGDPVRLVGDYLSSYYPDVYARLKSYAGRNAKRLATYGAVLGAPVIAYGGLGAANEILTAFVAPFIDPWKKAGKEKAKDTTEKLIEVANKLTVAGPDKYPEKIAALHELQAAFAADNFSSRNEPSRAKIKEKMDKYEAGFIKILPEFHEVMLTLDKTFDEKWLTDVKDRFSKIPGYRNGYDVKRSTVDQLSALIESRRDAPATPDELSRLSFWSSKLAESEDEISDALVSWQLYRLNVGAGKLDPVIEKEYQRLYNDYVKVMDMDKFRKKLAAILDPVVANLEGWADKAKAAAKEEKPLPTPGKLPEVPSMPPTQPY